MPIRINNKKQAISNVTMGRAAVIYYELGSDIFRPSLI